MGRILTESMLIGMIRDAIINESHGGARNMRNLMNRRNPERRRNMKDMRMRDFSNHYGGGQQEPPSFEPYYTNNDNSNDNSENNNNGAFVTSNNDADNQGQNTTGTNTGNTNGNGGRISDTIEGQIKAELSIIKNEIDKVISSYATNTNNSASANTKSDADVHVGTRRGQIDESTVSVDKALDDVAEKYTDPETTNSVKIVRGKLKAMLGNAYTSVTMDIPENLDGLNKSDDALKRIGGRLNRLIRDPRCREILGRGISLHNKYFGSSWKGWANNLGPTVTSKQLQGWFDGVIEAWKLINQNPGEGVKKLGEVSQSIGAYLNGGNSTNNNQNSVSN